MKSFFKGRSKKPPEPVPLDVAKEILRLLAEASSILDGVDQNPGSISRVEEVTPLTEQARRLARRDGGQEWQYVEAAAYELEGRSYAAEEQWKEASRAFERVLACQPMGHPDRKKTLINAGLAAIKVLPKPGWQNSRESLARGTAHLTEALTLDVTKDERWDCLNELYQAHWREYRNPHRIEPHVKKQSEVSTVIGYYNEANKIRLYRIYDRIGRHLYNYAVAELNREMLWKPPGVACLKAILDLPQEPNRTKSLLLLARAAHATTYYPEVMIWSNPTFKECLDLAISYVQTAYEEDPAAVDGESLVVAALDLERRFYEYHSAPDLDQAIETLAKVRERPDEDGVIVSRATFSLGSIYCIRYEVQLQPSDFDNAITYLSEAYRGFREHPDIPLANSMASGPYPCLARMVHAHYLHYRHTYSPDDLAKVVDYERDANGIKPLGADVECYQMKVGRAVGRTLWSGFTRGDVSETRIPHIITSLENALALDDRTLALPGPERRKGIDPTLSPSDRIAVLIDLSGAHHACLDSAEFATHLVKGVQYAEQAAKACAPGSLERLDVVVNLARKLDERFRRYRSSFDLADIIKYRREALDLYPADHADRSEALADLGLAFWVRFRGTKAAGDLEISISHLQSALTLCASRDGKRVVILKGLAKSLHSRYRLGHEIIDLDNAVSHYIEALNILSSKPDTPLPELTIPSRHGEEEVLEDLADRLEVRFKQSGRLEDLTEAITFGREILNLCHPGHHGRDDALIKLSLHLKARSKLTGDQSERQEARRYRQEAVRLRQATRDVSDSQAEACDSDSGWEYGDPMGLSPASSVDSMERSR